MATDSLNEVKQEVSEVKVEAEVAETSGGEPKVEATDDWKVKAEAAQAEIARLRKEIGDKERGNARLSREKSASQTKLELLEDKLEALLEVKRREEGYTETPSEPELGIKGIEQEVAKRQAARQKEQPSGDASRPWTPEEHRTFGRMEALGETVGVDIKKVPPELLDVINVVGELFTGGDTKAAEGKWKEGLKTYAEQLTEKQRAKEEDIKRKAASVHSAGGGSTGVNNPNLSSRELARQAYSQSK